MNWIRVGAVWGLLGVGLGAFGAHGLEKLDPGAEAIGWWETATFYHLVHAPVIVLVGFMGKRNAAGWAFLLGGIVFSGTLYAMALGAPRWFGAITPIGGVSLIAGWLLLGRRTEPE